MYLDCNTYPIDLIGSNKNNRKFFYTWYYNQSYSINIYMYDNLIRKLLTTE